MQNDIHTVDEMKHAIDTLSFDERKQLLYWLQEQLNEKNLATFSFITSQSVLEKEWLNKEEDKAWENL
ncbi:MAG: hypothetical protein JST29_00480 [Bacteroidetes bacterium]|nr:hypothetical protein [Bacteroidota bacterium]MBS1591749.1 hypothetical protein [Bacteroidota bacterium]